MDKKKKPRPVKRGNLVSYHLRLSPAIMEKIGWIAENQGTTTSEIVRGVLRHAARDAKPPVRLETNDIKASETEWRDWREVAETLGVSVDALLRKVMNKVAANYRP